MGCGGSKTDTKVAAAPGGGGDGGGGAVDVPTDPVEFTKKFHSKVRWGKELPEVTPFIDANPEGINCKDAGNGNTDFDCVRCISVVVNLEGYGNFFTCLHVS